MSRSVFFFCFLIGLFTITSCEKDDATPQAAQNAAEAELRLGNVKKWIISDALFNGTYIIKDKVILDADQDGVAEWLVFDIDNKTVEVKYPMEDETTFFDYTIENDIFKIKHPDGEEEVMTIKSGSVFVDHFSFEQIDGTDKFEVRLIAQ